MLMVVAASDGLDGEDPQAAAKRNPLSRNVNRPRAQAFFTHAR
jgi:hypothetical protein